MKPSLTLVDKKWKWRYRKPKSLMAEIINKMGGIDRLERWGFGEIEL